MRVAVFTMAALALALAAKPVQAQAPAAPGPGQPGPAQPATPPAAQARPPLVADPGDPVNVDEVALPEKPALVLSGSSNWEDGLKNIRAAFGQIEAAIGRIGATAAGRPLTVFTQTSDDDFKYEAMIPLAAAPPPGAQLPAGMRAGVTPSGKAWRFVHKGPYDDIDTTYETITTYLEVKDIVARDAFVEEYLNDVTNPSDPALELNIYVQPK